MSESMPLPYRLPSRQADTDEGHRRRPDEHPSGEPSLQVSQAPGEDRSDGLEQRAVREVGTHGGNRGITKSNSSIGVMSEPLLTPVASPSSPVRGAGELKLSTQPHCADILSIQYAPSSRISSLPAPCRSVQVLRAHAEAEPGDSWSPLELRRTSAVARRLVRKCYVSHKP